MVQLRKTSGEVYVAGSVQLAKNVAASLSSGQKGRSSAIGRDVDVK